MEIFQVYGEISELRLKDVKKNSDKKSYCFVLFKQIESAIKCLNDKDIKYDGVSINCEETLLKEELNSI